MAILAEVSIGEFLDKMTILQIKSERIRDPKALANVRRELESLRSAWARSPFAVHDVSEGLAALRAVNERLWTIEDRLREMEAKSCFDQEFVALARSVYLTNDERTAIKHRLNLRFGSALIEEKSHPEYRTRAV